MKTLTITITGLWDQHLEDGLDEVRRLVANGNTSGQNRNETGSFSFDVDDDGRDAEESDDE